MAIVVKMKINGRSFTSISKARFTVALSLIVIVAGLLELSIMHGTIWYSDEFRFGLDYRGLSHNIFKEEFGFVFPFTRIAYNTLFRLFGFRTYLPFRVMGVSCTVALACSVGVYTARVANRALGLILAAYFMLLGSSFHNLLWPAASISELGLAALPIGLTLLMRAQRSSTIAAFFAFGIAFGFAGPQAVAPVFGCLVFLAMERRWRATLAPILWFGYYMALVYFSHYRSPAPIFTNILNAPGFVYRAAIGGASGAMGLESSVGPVALAAFLVAVAVGFRKLPKARQSRVLGIASMMVAFWLITAVLRGHLNEPAAPRYLVFTVAGYVLILVELSTLVIWTAYRRTLSIAIIVFATLGNTSMLVFSGRAFRFQSENQRAELAALELSFAHAAPTYQPDPTTMPYISAAPYQNAIRTLGSPALSFTELPSSSESARESADRVLLELGSVLVTGTPVADKSGASCRALGGPSSTIELAPTDAPIYVQNVGVLPVEIKARRFAGAFPSTSISEVFPGRAVQISTIADRSPVGWTLDGSGDSWLVCEHG